MKKKKMTKKALNLAEHKSRLESAGGSRVAAGAWSAALAALGVGLLILFLLR